MKEELKKFLENDFGIISFNYDELEFANSQTFEKLQHGYRFNPKTQESLISDEPGAWKESWYVLIYIDGNAVIFNSENGQIYSLAHGIGDWEPEYFCQNVNGLYEIASHFKRLSEGKENPVKYVSKPLSNSEKERFFDTYAKAEGDTEFWESLLE